MRRIMAEAKPPNKSWLPLDTGGDDANSERVNMAARRGGGPGFIWTYTLLQS